MIKLVAFDWNGTLLSDTLPVVRAENLTRLKFGLQETNLKDFQNEYDIPISNYWINAGLDEKIFRDHADDIHKTFISYYEPQEKLCRTRSGTREILGWLKENNSKVVIFSNHIVPHIEAQSKRLKIDQFVDGILARGSVNDFSHMQAKGKAEKLFDFVKNLKLNPSEIITVGDTIEETEIGKKYGYTTVALTGGYQSTKRLKATAPDYLVNNLIELKDIIEQINGRTN